MLKKVSDVQEHGVTPDLKSLAQQLHEDLHNMVTDFKANNPHHVGIQDKKEDPIFGQLESVIAAGGHFESDSAVGRRFYADLKNDPALKKAKNDECRGKGKQVLLAFREKWASTKLKHVSSTKSRISQVVDLVSLNAEYCTLDRAWYREGATEAAWETAVTFLKSALEKFQAGEGFHGHPSLKFDDMRKTTMVREGWALGVCGGQDGGALSPSSPIQQ